MSEGTLNGPDVSERQANQTNQRAIGHFVASMLAETMKSSILLPGIH